MKNNISGVRGMLLFKDGNFLQVLEEEQDEVEQLYARIKKDDRHTIVYELFHEKVRIPVFHEYNSKFNIVTSSFDLISLKSFLKRQKYFGAVTDVSEKLNSFLRMDWA